MRLHILTACSRDWNIPAVARSIMVAAAGHDDLEIIWHIRKDERKRFVGGQVLKSLMIDQIHDGWVWVLDDDTVVHPELFTALLSGDLTGKKAVIVSQERPDLGHVLRAVEGCAVRGNIDAGQAIIRREAIGYFRFKDYYEGDGEFIEAVVDSLAPTEVLYLDRPLSLYNALSTEGGS